MEHSIRINVEAPVEQVWEVLGEVERWPARRDLKTRPMEQLKPEVFENPKMRLVHDMVEWSTDISVLGAAPRTLATETIQFRCEGKQVSLGGDTTTWVHPELFLGPSLYEPRAPRQG